MAKGNNKEKEAIKTYKDSVRQAESGGNNKAKNSRSSARGLFQFTDATWKEMEKKVGKSLNIDSEADQELAMDKLTSMNAEALTKNGLPVTASNLYMTHVLGISGGPKFLKNLKENPNELATKYVSAAAAKANPNIFYKDGKPTSASDVFNKLTNKVKQSTGSGVKGGITGLDSDIQQQEQTTPLDYNSGLEGMEEYDPSGLVPQQQNQQQLAEVNQVQDKNQFEFNKVEKERQALGMSGDLDFLSSTAGLAFQEQDREAEELARQQVNMAKDGGQINLSNGELNEFNEGGKHEENMFGGIPQGIGANGKLNTVEEGETKFNGYVFSDTLKINQSDIDSLFLPKELKDKTFAEASKYINNVLKDNPNDNIIKKTVKKQLDSLTLGNEKARLSKEEMDLNMEEDSDYYPEEESMEMTSNQMFLGGDEDKEQIDPSKEDYAQAAGTALSLGNMAFGNTGIDTTGADGQMMETGSVGGGMAKGAMSGASAGAAFGPWGAAIGGVVGGAAGWIGGAKAKRDGLEHNKNVNIKNSMQNVNDFSDGGSFGDLTDKKNSRKGLIDQFGMYGNFDVQNEPLGYGQFPQGPITDGDEYASLVGNRYPGSYDDTYVKPEDPYAQKERGVSAMQYAPILGNALNYLDSRKDKADMTSLDRIDSRFKPSYVDEMTLQNSIGNDFDNTVNSLSSATNGSEGALRANILGAGLNRSKAMSDAYIKADEINRNQDTAGQQFNLQIDQGNVSQSNLEKDINAKSIAATEDGKTVARNRLFDSIGGLGKEQTYNNRLQTMTGYDSQGNYTQGDQGLLERLKKLLESSNSKEFGGMITSPSKTEEGTLQSMLEEEIRKKYR